jgi:hypothetical protein
LINQVPIQEKPNAYIRKIKTVQFIYIFKKAGLINQTPTEEDSKSYRTIIHLYIKHSGGFDKSNPYRRIKSIQE